MELSSIESAPYRYLLMPGTKRQTIMTNTTERMPPMSIVGPAPMMEDSMPTSTCPTLFAVMAAKVRIEAARPSNWSGVVS